MIKSINHIGIAVKDLHKSAELFQKIFGFEHFHKEIVEDQKVEIASFNVGRVKIELTAPINQDSPIFKFIEKRGEGIHHIAFEIDALEDELSKLKSMGIQLINENPVEGAHNMLIAFLHPKSTNGVLIELCQLKKEKN